MVRVKKDPLSVEGFLEYVDAIQECGDHPLASFTPEVRSSIDRVVDAYIEEAETYENTKSFILVQMHDGSYGVFNEWSDSSGHG